MLLQLSTKNREIDFSQFQNIRFKYSFALTVTILTIILEIIFAIFQLGFWKFQEA